MSERDPLYQSRPELSMDALLDPNTPPDTLPFWAIPIRKITDPELRRQMGDVLRRRGEGELDDESTARALTGLYWQNQQHPDDSQRQALQDLGSFFASDRLDPDLADAVWREGLPE